MVEGQLDEVEDDRPIMKDKGPARSLSRGFQSLPCLLSSRRNGMKADLMASQGSAIGHTARPRLSHREEHTGYERRGEAGAKIDPSLDWVRERAAEAGRRRSTDRVHHRPVIYRILSDSGTYHQVDEDSDEVVWRSSGTDQGGVWSRAPIDFGDLAGPEHHQLPNALLISPRRGGSATADGPTIREFEAGAQLKVIRRKNRVRFGGGLPRPVAGRDPSGEADRDSRTKP